MKENLLYGYTAFLAALRLLIRRKRWIAPLLVPLLLTIPFLLLPPQERAAPLSLSSRSSLVLLHFLPLEWCHLHI